MAIEIIPIYQIRCSAIFYRPALQCSQNRSRLPTVVRSAERRLTSAARRGARPSRALPGHNQSFLRGFSPKLAQLAQLLTFARSSY
jgi:hypothetical protein